MNHAHRAESLLSQLGGLNEQQLRRLLVEHLTKQKLGLYWEANSIERDAALNANVVLPRLVEAWSHAPAGGEKADAAPVEGAAGFLHRNLVIEGDNFDALRLLKATHAGKIRVIYIDPPYNTGNKDWVYNDRYVGANDRWRHSQWLEFLYRRLTLARDLLTPDGVILVSINDENRARLELLMDEVFPGMRVGSLVWRKRRASNAAGMEHFFSEDHENILVYCNSGFEFNGSAKTWSGYTNWDEEKQDWWASADLTLGFTSKERKNLFFPLRDIKTDIWYPCDPNRVWAYASRDRLGSREVRTRPMEDWIADDCVYFAPEENPAIYTSLAELTEAIEKNNAPPFLHKSDDLNFWLHKKIGFNKPRFKRFKSKLRNAAQPLSSWVSELGKLNNDGESLELTSGMTSEGTKALRNIELDQAFPYPKPLSLIKGLLSQTTRPNDIVLDFFAGSGTTGQAVLELNAEDGGRRRFILCSSTEATTKEPDKNLCRDVCAERLRRVIQGYGGKPGHRAEQGGEFAYLQLDLAAPADALFEATPAHAFQLLSLKRLGVAQTLPDSDVKWLGRAGDCDLLACFDTGEAVIRALAAWPQRTGIARLAVYSPRPDSLRECLSDRGIEANCYPLLESALRGQGEGA